VLVVGIDNGSSIIVQDLNTIVVVRKSRGRVLLGWTSVFN
jgi:hypothetical protein